MTCNCSFETVVPAVAVSVDRIGVEGGEGWVGVPGVVDRALESTGGHLLETLRLTAHLPTRNAAARVPQTVWISIRVF